MLAGRLSEPSRTKYSYRIQNSITISNQRGWLFGNRTNKIHGSTMFHSGLEWHKEGEGAGKVGGGGAGVLETITERKELGSWFQCPHEGEWRDRTLYPPWEKRTTEVVTLLHDICSSLISSAPPPFPPPSASNKPSCRPCKDHEIRTCQHYAL